MSSPIRPLPFEDLDPELRERLGPRVRRLGYLGDFFAVTGHHPRVLGAFIDFTEAGRAGLPDDVAELIALTISTFAGSAYERHQHERLAVRLALDAGWVREVERLDPDAAELSAVQRVVQRYVLAASSGLGRGARPALRAVVETLGEPAAVAVMLVVGRYLAHALVVNSCEFEPPVASIFEAAIGSGT